MSWKKAKPNVIDLSGLPELPVRIELHAQGKDADGEFECRQARHDLREERENVPVRNAKGEIESKKKVTRSFVGGTLDEKAKTVTLPARPGWPAAPFTMVKVTATMDDDSVAVLMDKVPAE